MKIGVLADTHVPDILPSLPPRVLEIFSNVDIILHAGDIRTLTVLNQLEPIAQTFAVYGDADSEEVCKYLQEKARLEFAGRAIGLVHGHRSVRAGLLARTLQQLNHQRHVEAVCNSVVGEFSDVDAIVFGHTHVPYMKMHGGVMLFNPGSIISKAGEPGSVGILEITNNAIKGRIIPL